MTPGRVPGAAERPEAVARVMAAVPALRGLSASRFVTEARQMIEACAASLAVEFALDAAAARAGLIAAVQMSEARGRAGDGGGVVSMVEPGADDGLIEAGRRCLPPGDRE